MKKFNGSLMPNEEVEDSENYWKLLSKKVTVCAFAEEEKFPNNERVLVQFDCDLEDLGLISHNRLQNSLWILKSDLEPVIE